MEHRTDPGTSGQVTIERTSSVSACVRLQTCSLGDGCPGGGRGPAARQWPGPHSKQKAARREGLQGVPQPTPISSRAPSGWIHSLPSSCRPDLGLREEDPGPPPVSARYGHPEKEHVPGAGVGTNTLC